MIPKELQKDNLYFQYRPISRTSICGDEKKYKDIERLIDSELYFAPLYQLNDPIDGKIQYYWKAEKSIWQGVIFHYAVTLYTRLIIISLGETEIKTISDFNVTGYLDNEHVKTTVRTKLGDFFNTEYGQKVLSDLSLQEEILTEMLMLYFNIFVNHKLFELFLVDPFTSIFKQEAIDYLISQMTNKDLFKEEFFKDYKPELHNDYISLISERFYSVINDCDHMNPLFYLKNSFSYDFFNKFQTASLHEWGVTSLSKNCTNELMWAHYAESHRGICLVFELDCNIGQLVQLGSVFDRDSIEYFRDNIALGGFVRFDKVLYDDLVIKKNIFSLMECFTRGTADDIFSYYDGGIDGFCNREDRIKHINEALFDASCHKKTKWSYEEEYRMVMSGIHKRYGRKTSLKYNLSLLKGIIFGHSIDREIKEKTIAAINELYKESDTKPIFYQARYSSYNNEINVFLDSMRN